MYCNMQRCGDDCNVGGTVEGIDQLEAVGYGQFKSYSVDLAAKSQNGIQRKNTGQPDTGLLSLMECCH